MIRFSESGSILHNKTMGRRYMPKRNCLKLMLDRSTSKQIIGFTCIKQVYLCHQLKMKQERCIAIHISQQWFTKLWHRSSSSVICQTTSPKPLPKRFLHIVRSRASSFNWQYPVLSLKSSSSFLRLLPHLLVTSNGKTKINTVHK